MGFSLKVSVSKTVKPFLRDGNVGVLEEPLTGMCEWVAIPCSMMPPILFILSQCGGRLTGLGEQVGVEM